MPPSLVLALNEIDKLKHILYKDYRFPQAIAMLNRTQERILMTIKYGNELSMVNIARAIGIEKGPFSQTVDKLEQMELVSRERAQADKRNIYLKLSPKGEALVKIVEESMDSHFANKTKHLKEEEQTALYDALATLEKIASTINKK